MASLGLRRSAQTYQSHRNLLLLAREQIAYDKMNKSFVNNHIGQLPDVVLTLDKRENLIREGVVLSIRRDYESALSASSKESLLNSLSKAGYKYTELDTCTLDGLPLNAAFERILNVYSCAKVVVTDRLHGMIFAYITGTPAIVLPNNNGKVVASYKWISECGYIKLINKEQLPQIPTLVRSLENMKVDNGSFCDRRRKFVEMYKDILYEFLNLEK